MGKLSFIFERHSVREYKNDDIPERDIMKILEAATQAPSGGNDQNWHFVVLKNRERILKLAEIIENENEMFVKDVLDKEIKDKFRKYVKFQTVFKSAPVVIFAYAGPYRSFDYIVTLKLFKEKNYPVDEIERYKNTTPSVQNVAAAMENLMLSAAALGYGTCWMTSQNFVIKKIEEFVGLNKPGYRLIAMTPLGIPKDVKQKSPPRKNLGDVITILN